MSVNVIGDTAKENAETFGFGAVGSQLGTTLSDGSGRATIVNDD